MSTKKQIEDGKIVFKRFQIQDPKTRKCLLSDTLKKRKKNVTRPIPITEELKNLLLMLAAVHVKFYPDSEFVFPDSESELGCLKLTRTYDLYKAICRDNGITLSRNAIKGTHSFRRNKASEMSTNGAPLTVISDFLGNSPKVLESNYRLKTRSVAEALRYQKKVNT